MHIYYVTSTDPRRSGPGEYTFPFECAIKTVAELIDTLEQRAVAGSQLVYKTLPDGRRLITKRIGMGLKKEAYKAIVQSRWKFVDTD